MVRIESEIKYLISQLSCKHTYIYDTWDRVNVQLDKVPEDQFPVAVVIPPINGQMIVKKARIVDAPNFLISFLGLAELDFDGDVNELTLTKEKDCAKEFVHLCNASGYFEPIERCSYTDVFERLDANVTGVVLEVNLQEKKGTAICISPDIKFPEPTSIIYLKPDVNYPEPKTFSDSFDINFD